MIEFLKFAAMWFLFMGIIVVIALITPKIAPAVERFFKSFKGKKEFRSPYDISDEVPENGAADETEKE
ncbi:MAG: hypothetical protein E7525_06020 [Ruminococcaceae bacterium]|nr:hypothetical protein [Oscillospiraceae bacterium]